MSCQQTNGYTFWGFLYIESLVTKAICHLFVLQGGPNTCIFPVNALLGLRSFEDSYSVFAFKEGILLLLSFPFVSLSLKVIS